MLRNGIILFCFLFVTLFAQNARVGDGGPRALLTVPMVGAGTWADPKRPAFVRELGIPFRYEVSDDGTMALVEASPRNLAEMRKLDEVVQKEPRAKMFRPEKDKAADVSAEFKKHKKDFDADSFTKLGPGVKTAPVTEPGK